MPGSHPGTVITWWTISPALLILIFPLGFRLTCYYYRKAYYRSFWLAPPACAVSDGHGSYSGETRFPLLLQNIHRYFFYFGLVFNVILTIDAIVAFRQPGYGIGFSVGTAVLVDQRHAPVAVLAELPRLSPPVRWRGQAVLGVTHPAPDLEDPHPAQCQAHGVRLDEPGLRGLHRSLRSAGGQWDHPRLRLPLLRGIGHMAEYETHDFDVIIVGAGGAGLRAAIEARAQGLRTALVCKSLLGKAHTVMAEGGVAAALGNVYAEDSWQVHFRDTMRGGKMLNNWRMAQLHAQEAPDRVRELEDWGALFDRTKDGLILQRDFGATVSPDWPISATGPGSSSSAHSSRRRSPTASRCSWRSRCSASSTTPTAWFPDWSATGARPVSSWCSRPRRW